MWNYMFRGHEGLYNVLKPGSESMDFCQLNAGEGIAGAQIKVDLWFWSKEWNFASGQGRQRKVYGYVQYVTPDSEDE